MVRHQAKLEQPLRSHGGFRWAALHFHYCGNYVLRRGSGGQRSAGDRQHQRQIRRLRGPRISHNMESHLYEETVAFNHLFALADGDVRRQRARLRDTQTASSCRSVGDEPVDCASPQIPMCSRLTAHRSPRSSIEARDANGQPRRIFNFELEIIVADGVDVDYGACRARTCRLEAMAERPFTYTAPPAVRRGEPSGVALKIFVTPDGN